MEAIPSVEKRKEALKSIPGSVPNLINPPSGCRFHPRCPYAKEICKEKEPELFDSRVACWLYGEAR
jgi:peptide/nickel transport system ATP-binding protein